MFAAKLVAVLLGVAPAPQAPARDGRVRLVRVPDGGIQPQALVDSNGDVELLFFRGKPGGGSLFVAKSSDGARNFSAARPVNGATSCAIATGTVRSARFVLGRGDSLHVVWMGGDGAQPRAPHDATPLLYSRLLDGAQEFEPPRNLITEATGLDGGFDVAADGRGAVAVVWHAPPAGGGDESSRRIWLARSSDDGATFAAERAIDPERHGVCPCCGMRAAFVRVADRGDLSLCILYRCALRGTNRDMHELLVAAPAPKAGGDEKVRSLDLDAWPANGCVMSTAALTNRPARFDRAGAPGQMLAAWETRGQIYARDLAGDLAADATRASRRGPKLAAPGLREDRKHPRLAVNNRGEWLLAWTEGTGWQKGGALAWQLFGADGHPREGAGGRVDGVPVWSFGEPVALSDGNFVILY